jgi:hypothetical protein
MTFWISRNFIQVHKYLQVTETAMSMIGMIGQLGTQLAQSGTLAVPSIFSDCPENLLAISGDSGSSLADPSQADEHIYHTLFRIVIFALCSTTEGQR